MNNGFQYTEEYYIDVIKKYGYDPFTFGRFDFNIGSMTDDELNLRYLCHQNVNKYLETPTEKRLVLTGFGMSGVPHLGSISQIIRLINFQNEGENCELILGDLDAYNGRGVPLEKATALAHKFRIFATKLGLNKPTSTIRIQSESSNEILNFYLLGKYSTDDSLSKYEEDIHDLYVSKGIVSHDLNFPRRMSLMLMVSDFISAGQTYDSVVGIIGIDEHKYVLYAKEIQSRILKSESGLRSDFGLSCIYNRLNKGFGDYPKMSKSFPESGIKVTDSPQKITSLLSNEPTPENPYESLVFQLMIQLHYLKHDRVEEVVGYYNTPRWTEEVDSFITFIIDITSLWDN